MNETWKPIKGYEGSYEVSNLGNVRGLNRVVQRRTSDRFVKGQIMSKHLMPNGYETVMLRDHGHKKRFYVHRLVAEAFLPNEDNLREVNHKDENKSNNVLENLEWCSHSYNMKYAGGSIRRIKNRRKPVVVIDHGEPIRFESIASAASWLGVGLTSVSRCCHHVKGTKRVHGKLTMFEHEFKSLAPLTAGGEAKASDKTEQES